jgi:UDP-N-acetylmuramoyl-L-alanyl-D-glutamate--2,6-diaminopimelate ligase
VLLSELLGEADVAELRGDPRIEVSAVTHDSRQAGPGTLFCCVPGSTTDGHDHAPQAVAAGASALLVERFLDLPVPQARVASVRVAMGPVAAACAGHPSRRMRVLGVTGTNGKTTTTYLLEAIAGAAGLRAGVIGTVETRIDGRRLPGERTTPESTDLQALLARMVADAVDVAAIEVSSHAMAYHRVDGTWFAAACFTNLSHDHLDFHGDLAGYFEAKASLFDPVRTGAGAVNLDDPKGVELARRAEGAGLAVTGFGLEAPGAAVRAEAVEGDASGNRFVLVAVASGDTPYPGDGRAEVRSPLVGRFNVSNALAAAATALAAGIPFAAVVEGLSAPVVVPGRMERIEGGQPFAVLVDYAHTPEGLDQVLRTARRLAGDGGGRVLVVFGCGGDRDRAKRPAMGRMAATLADAAWVTNDNPRSEDPAAIAAEVVAGYRAAGAGSPPQVELDRREAIGQALAAAGPGDVVVVAGKGHESGQTAGGVTVPFDDRVVAAEELARLGFGKAASCA